MRGTIESSFENRVSVIAVISGLQSFKKFQFHSSCSDLFFKELIKQIRKRCRTTVFHCVSVNPLLFEVELSQHLISSKLCKCSYSYVINRFHRDYYFHSC